MDKKRLYYFFLRNYFFKLNKRFSNKRNYFPNFISGKYDFIFNIYTNNIIKKMLFLSESKRIFLKRKLKRKIFKKKIFKKLYIKMLSFNIRNEYLLTIPSMFYKHKKRKIWGFINYNKNYKSKKNKYWKIRKKKLLKNIKKLKIYKYPIYREVFELKYRLNKIYFWLVNTSKKQISTLVKYNKLKYTKDIIKNYFRIKNNFYFEKKRFLKKRKKIIIFFNKRKKFYFNKIYKFYFNFYKKLLLLIFTKYKIFFKYNFYKHYFIFIKILRKTLINKLTKFYLLNSFKELRFLKKFKIRKRIKKKLLFIYRLSKYLPRIYKLKVKMVNSNFFITLTDPKDKVIISKSTGQVSGNRKKKVKLSPYLVIRMMYGILNKLKKLRIKYLFFFINTKINRHINNVMKILRNFHYTKIVKIFFSKPIAHHFGTRKPKLRRL